MVRPIIFKNLIITSQPVITNKYGIVFIIAEMVCKVFANSVINIFNDLIFVICQNSIRVISQTDLRIIARFSKFLWRNDIRFIRHRYILFFNDFFAMLRVIGISLFLKLSGIVHKVRFQLSNICFMLIFFLNIIIFYNCIWLVLREYGFHRIDFFLGNSFIVFLSI